MWQNAPTRPFTDRVSGPGGPPEGARPPSTLAARFQPVRRLERGCRLALSGIPPTEDAAQANDPPDQWVHPPPYLLGLPPQDTGDHLRRLAEGLRHLGREHRIAKHVPAR